MHRKSIIHKISAAILVATAFFYATAQNINCDVAVRFLPDIDARVKTISTTNPEVISLHYLFVSEMLDSVHSFQDNYLPNLHFCPQIDFFATLHQCNALEIRLRELKDSLDFQRKRVDTLFCLLAEEELHFSDTAMAEYYIDRSLQFNRKQSRAYILRLQLDFAQRRYDECISTLHIIYDNIPLTREEENFLSDFNTDFYQILYQKGDSLIKAGSEAEALPLFETLETFCHDMPSEYCNDDYYHGIIRSKSGVYESYLTIARVAWRRGNAELAFKFLDYAKGYFLENEDEVEIPERFTQFIEEMEARRGNYHFNQ